MVQNGSCHFMQFFSLIHLCNKYTTKTVILIKAGQQLALVILGQKFTFKHLLSYLIDKS